MRGYWAYSFLLAAHIGTVVLARPSKMYGLNKTSSVLHGDFELAMGLGENNAQESWFTMSLVFKGTVLTSSNLAGKGAEVRAW